VAPQPAARGRGRSSRYPARAALRAPRWHPAALSATQIRSLTCTFISDEASSTLPFVLSSLAGGRDTHHMSFKVGDTVVYPHHGAARIEAVENRLIKGEEKTYLVLKVDKGDLTVRVPADNAELVGVRDVVGQEGLERVFEVLRAPHTEEPTNWSRRYKANLEKLASGDVNKVAEVVRDLWRRDRERGLSAGEKRMLAKARQILVSELALAEKTNEDKAEALLDEVLVS
jgi:CarD family transcriptional regulator